MWSIFSWVGNLFKHGAPAPITSAPVPDLAKGDPSLDRVLLVGINKYPAPNALSGCVYDVSNIGGFLKSHFGFVSPSFRILLDGDATTANILAGMKWLVGTPPGGRAYFHYSGHGAQVPIGDPQSPTNLYQVICPVDFDWSMDHMITDKQFVEAFKDMVDGVRFYWASDSCHSGGLDRDMVMGVNPRYMPPTPGIAASIAAAAANGVKSERTFVNGIIDVGFLSGCKADQTSADAFIGGQHCGAFTYYMVKVMGENPGKSLSDIAAIMRQQLADAGYEQEPGAEGPRAGMPFMS